MSGVVLLESKVIVLEEESLRTFLCEAESIVNNRPLTIETLSNPLSEPPC